MRIMHNLACGAAVLVSTGCAATRPQVSSDLQAGLQVATGLETIYAGAPSADPKVVAKLTQLLGEAQAAVGLFAVSESVTDQVAAENAIAAVLVYAASHQ